MDNKDVIYIQAVRCKRCGRLLTSKKAMQDGYGESCRCKARKEELEKAPIPGQMSITDYLDDGD